MRRLVCGILVGVLLIGLGITGLSARPTLRAKGEFWTELHIAGQWFDMQFAFNVQDRGEDDHGNLSMRIFDHWTGDLVAVGLSHGELHVFEVGEWVLFETPMRTSYFDPDYYLPFHYPVFLFQAYDGGNADQFKLFNVSLPILKGKIVVR